MYSVNPEVDDVLTVQVPPGPALVLAFPYFFQPADSCRRKPPSVSPAFFNTPPALFRKTSLNPSRPCKSVSWIPILNYVTFFHALSSLAIRLMFREKTHQKYPTYSTRSYQLSNITHS